MTFDDYDDERLMELSGERSERRRRLMVAVMLFAMAAMVLVPVIQAFT